MFSIFLLPGPLSLSSCLTNLIFFKVSEIVRINCNLNWNDNAAFKCLPFSVGLDRTKIDFAGIGNIFLWHGNHNNLLRIYVCFKNHQIISLSKLKMFRRFLVNHLHWDARIYFWMKLFCRNNSKSSLSCRMNYILLILQWNFHEKNCCYSPISIIWKIFLWYLVFFHKYNQ